MNDKACPHEDSVVQAVRNGRWSEALRAHVSQCEYCSEVEQISRFMSNVAKNYGVAEPIPYTNLVWLKAQLDEQERLEIKVLRPMILAQTAVKLGVLVLLSILILWIWPTVSTYIVRLLTLIPDILIHPSLPSISGPIAYLTSPAAILLCFALGYFFLQSPIRALSK